LCRKERCHLRRELLVRDEKLSERRSGCSCRLGLRLCLLLDRLRLLGCVDYGLPLERLWRQNRRLRSLVLLLLLL
jgi:hypothetical protein